MSDNTNGRQGAKVDHQDGGPASHTNDGGEVNDVASGGVGESTPDSDKKGNAQDVHGDQDTVS